jgi:hypothetical protein
MGNYIHDIANVCMWIKNDYDEDYRSFEGGGIRMKGR